MIRLAAAAGKYLSRGSNRSKGGRIATNAGVGRRGTKVVKKGTF